MMMMVDSYIYTYVYNIKGNGSHCFKFAFVCMKMLTEIHFQNWIEFKQINGVSAISDKAERLVNLLCIDGRIQ